MDLDTVKASLRQLHDDMESGGKLDPELMSLLKTLEDDLHRSVASGETGAESFTERAQALGARFTTDHPYLAGALRNLADALGKMGI